MLGGTRRLDPAPAMAVGDEDDFEDDDDNYEDDEDGDYDDDDDGDAK